jgi:hypothetical protein
MPGRRNARIPHALILIVLVAGIAVMATLAGCLQDARGTGTLTGTVSIAPLCPVEPCTISPGQLAAAYAARPIIISSSSGAVVAMVTADPGTGYTVALEPGTYRVDVRHQGIGGSLDLPATVTIRPGETARLNISIDTGIR